MKRLSLIFLILVSLFSFSFAQISPNWQSYSSKKEEFSLETPNLLNSFGIVSIDSVNLSDANERKYHSFFNGIDYFIISQSLTDTTLSKPLSQYIKINNAQMEQISSPIYSGTKCRFTDTDGYHHVVFIIKTLNRRYFFETLTQQNNTADINRFFSSIKIKGSALPYTFTNETEAPTSNNSSDNGNNNNAVQTSSKNTDPAISSLKITSKPRALYNDLARIYSVNGRIILKVTFLANGTIGDITPVNRLPFGLTAEAIKAAKSIKFEPSRKDNAPIDVTKTVEYTFTLLN